jgi:hypothetical protein
MQQATHAAIAAKLQLLEAKGKMYWTCYHLTLGMCQLGSNPGMPTPLLPATGVENEQLGLVGEKR